MYHSLRVLLRADEADRHEGRVAVRVTGYLARSPSRSLFARQPNALQVALKLTARLVAQQESLSIDIYDDSPTTIGSNSNWEWVVG